MPDTLTFSGRAHISRCPDDQQHIPSKVKVECVNSNRQTVRFFLDEDDICNLQKWLRSQQEYVRTTPEERRVLAAEKELEEARKALRDANPPKYVQVRFHGKKFCPWYKVSEYSAPVKQGDEVRVLQGHFSSLYGSVVDTSSEAPGVEYFYEVSKVS